MLSKIFFRGGYLGKLTRSLNFAMVHMNSRQLQLLVIYFDSKHVDNLCKHADNLFEKDNWCRNIKRTPCIYVFIDIHFSFYKSKKKEDFYLILGTCFLVYTSSSLYTYVPHDQISVMAKFQLSFTFPWKVIKFWPFWWYCGALWDTDVTGGSKFWKSVIFDSTIEFLMTKLF